MHRMFPPNVAGRTQVLLQFLELRYHVAVVSLENELGEKDAAPLEDGIRNLRRILHKRSEKALEDVGIRFQRQAEKLL